ncbi:unnamed protein product [Sphagnum jensenii]|uniref:Uncharacterized protein n=1 Tax=Sphagnum jensenii TaxID=128206 RepID=A0ABP1A9A7_9BRYO
MAMCASQPRERSRSLSACLLCRGGRRLHSRPMQAHLPIVPVYFHRSRTSVTSPKYRRSPSLEPRIPFDVSPGRCSDRLRDQKSVEEERRSRSSNFARSDVYLRVR